MWHEARRQEKKLRKVIVDYRKRSERRHLYYERIKQDPTKFLQVHGRKSKIHLDGTVASEADNNNHMMPWQGDSSNMIDRFDVRTHLDFYRDAPKSEETEGLTEEEQKCNFERYRVLIWNEHKNVSEQQHLRQIHIDEQFPEIAAQQKQRQDAEAQKQMLAQTKASIGYDYGGAMNVSSVKSPHSSRNRVEDDDADLDEEEDELDFLRELEEIPPLSEINMDSIKALDDIGVKKYKMRRGGFGDCLLDDQDYLDKIGEAKAIESEKQKFSGRKSRRERRILKDERLRGRKIEALSYVRRDANKMDKTSDSESTSSSSSSDSDSDDERYNGKRQKSNTIEYITSFGDDTEKPKTPTKRPMKTSTLKDWQRSESSSSSSEEESPAKSRRRRSRSRSSSSERYRSRHRRSRSGSRSRYRRHSSSSSRRDDRSRRSRSSSWGRSQRRSRSRSRGRRSRSRGRRSYSRERRSRTPESKYKSATATISSASSLLKGKTKESKAAAIKKLTPQERLKIKMQRALNKQLKVDRNAEMEKRMVKQQEQLDRQEDLREMSRKMLKRDMGEDERSMREYDDSHHY